MEEGENLQALMDSMVPNLKVLRMAIFKFERKLKVSWSKDYARMSRLIGELSDLKSFIEQSENKLRQTKLFISNILNLLPSFASASACEAAEKPEQFKDSAISELLVECEDRCASLGLQQQADHKDNLHANEDEDDNEVEDFESKLDQSPSYSGGVLMKEELHFKIKGSDVEEPDTASSLNKPTTKSLVEVQEHAATPFNRIVSPLQSIDITSTGNESKTEDDFKFECDLCAKKFQKRDTLRRHIKRIHLTERPKPICAVCGKVFYKEHTAKACKHQGKGLEKCGICGDFFPSKHRLREHKRLSHKLIKTEKLLFPCLICPATFESGQLDAHLALHVPLDGEQLQCRMCEKRFKHPKSLRFHLQRHNSKTHSCAICGKKGMTLRQWRQHRDTHNNQAACHICGKVMKSARRLKEHMNVHTGDKPFECNICHEKLSSSSALGNHKTRLHTPNFGECKCVICGQLFKTPFARNTHLIVKHTEEEREEHNVVLRTFMCDICGETLRLDAKTHHMRKHKAENSRRLDCKICGQKFLRLWKLKIHQLRHKDASEFQVALTQEEKGNFEKSLQFEREFEAKHVCNICGEKFCFLKDLTKHEREHIEPVKPRPYTCSICNASFTEKWRLGVHMEKKHSEGGMQIFQCKTCDKTFPSKTSLESHLKVHSVANQFLCPVCNVAFKTTANLQRHISSVHKGEKPFTCDVCGKSFNAKSNMQTHYRIHTGEKPFTCATCGRSFSDPSTFHKHRALHAKQV